MALPRRFRRGRATTFSILLFACLWLAASVAPVAAHTHPYRPGGHFTIDTDLTSRSGLSAWAIDRYLAAATPLPPIGQAFMAAERKYGVNARYLLAHALLESGFGTSDIARYAHNLFGYHAYDRDPWRYATRFPSYAAGIDAVAHAIATDYLDPHGRWWGGTPSLRGMHYYASDPDWGKKIAAIADGLDLPTLTRAGASFGPVSVADPVLQGESTDVRLGVDAGTGTPPSTALRFVVRWRPLAIVEADPAAAGGSVDGTDGATAVFGAPMAGAWHGQHIDLSVKAPAQPGRYALDVAVRDTDGAPLPDAARLAVAPAIVQVYPGHAVAYDAAATPASISFGATNLGPGSIHAAAPDAEREPNLPAATLVAWAIPLSGGSPVQVGHLALPSDLPVGGTITADVSSAALAALLPAVAVVRLIPAGLDPIEVGPPGVFRLDGPVDPAGSIAVTVVDPLDPASDSLLAGPAGGPTAGAPAAGQDQGSPAPIAVSVTTGVDPTITVSSPIVPAAGPGPIDGSMPDAAIRGTIALDAVPVSGLSATLLAVHRPFVPSSALRPGDPLGGTIPFGSAPSGPGAYLAVIRIAAAHGDGTVEALPVVFWLIVPDGGATASAIPGPTVATPATTDIAAGAPPPGIVTAPETLASAAVQPTPPVRPAVKPAAKPQPKPRPKPPAPRYRIHIVRAGETLWRIAHRAGVSVDAIRRLNPFVTRYGIHPGDALRIPG